MKKAFRSSRAAALLSVLVLMAVVVGPVAAKVQMPRFLTIGTAGIGGAYYPIGVAMADLLTKQISGTNVTAQVTGGAVENVKLVSDRSLDLAITQSPMAYAGMHGTAPFDKKHTNVATLFSGLSEGVFHVVARQTPDIKSIADLKGKRVVMGPAGGGAINVMVDVLACYGLTLSDIKATYISYEEGCTALGDGQVDAVIVQSAAPAPAINQLAAAKKPFQVLSIEDQIVRKLITDFPYYGDIKLPAAMYGTARDVYTIYTTNMVIVRRDFSDDQVYEMTRILFENIDAVKNSHPSARGLTLEKAVRAVPIPLHPGAERYFREKGVLK
ncbi:MAG: TAXI family TRAP transporter solute-binding subunit [Firmicutes bacterium]|jgi:TRAP transporter TAXI family solute receptor|nr:TAXI family TRAP transporter solute-binding subunit [Bacillota bacterium]